MDRKKKRFLKEAIVMGQKKKIGGGRKPGAESSITCMCWAEVVNPKCNLRKKKKKKKAHYCEMDKKRDRLCRGK